MKAFILIFFIAISLHSFSQGNNGVGWKMYGVSSENKTLTVYFIDSEYKARNDFGIKIWQRVEVSDSTSKNNSVTESLWVIDCNERKILPLEIIKRNFLNDAIINDTKLNPYSEQWMEVVPGTVGDRLVSASCDLFNK